MGNLLSENKDEAYALSEEEENSDTEMSQI